MVARHTKIGLIALCFFGFTSILNGHFLTRLINNDPSPIFSSTDPYDFLTQCRRQQLKDTYDDCCRPRFRIAFSPFYQFACKGGDLFGTTSPCQANCAAATETTPCACAETDVPNELAQLGDLTGPWNIIGLFYDSCKKTALIDALKIKQNNCSFQVGYDESGDNIVADYLTDPSFSDTKKRLGFFSVPIEYRKSGVRFESEFLLQNDITLSIHTGAVNITQNPEFLDLTCSATGLSCLTRDCKGDLGTDNSCKYNCCPPINPREDTVVANDGTTTPAVPCPNSTCCIDWANCPCKTMLIDKIMKKRELIAEVLGMNIKSFKKIDIEDIEVNLNFSHLCAINTDLSDWHSFVFMPFASVGFTIPMAAEKDYRYLFALPAGNNGHWSYGGRAGCIFDFFNAMTIGGEVGITGFSGHQHAHVPMPTSEFQSGIFPQLVSLEIRPGLNTHFTAYIGTYHFLERFSTYVQYVGILHEKDKFSSNCLTRNNTNNTRNGCTPDPILFEKRSNESEWNTHVLNAALNYDLAHCLQIGLVWQIPLSQRNAYSASTIMGTVQATF